MKKIILSIFIILLIVFFLFIPKEEELRVRIISNSDKPTDILYKEEVVDFFKEEILPYFDLSVSSINGSLAKIEEKMQSKFPNVKVTYTRHTFINKAYNGSALENGNYPTLLIEIGDALGSNWWGSIFEGEIIKESREEVNYEWYIKELLKKGER